MNVIKPPKAVSHLIDLALEEDWRDGDPSALSVPPSTLATATIIAKQPTIVSGLWLIDEILQHAQCVPNELHFFSTTGEYVEAQSKLASITTEARTLLGLERTILNFLQRTCGIATRAHQIRTLLGNRDIKILDTRKTIPGWRYLDKRSVSDGKLWNHRFNLNDGVLIKENHIYAAGGIKNAIENYLKNTDALDQLQMEVQSMDEAQEACTLGVRNVLLDNFSPSKLQKVVKDLRAQYPNLTLEASGNISITNLPSYLDSGVDRISMGCLTHSIESSDLSMLFSFHEK